MKLDFFMIADEFARDEERQKITIRGAAITHIRTTEFPLRVAQLNAVARFRLQEGDVEGGVFTIGVEALSPSGTRIGHAQMDITPEHSWSERSHPDEDKSIWFVVDLSGMTFAEAGAYRIILRLRGKKIDERKLIAVTEASASDETPAGPSA